MADFRFDDRKNFEENCEVFLEAIKADDPEMAAILRDNWNTLVSIVRGRERDFKARSEFNTNVAAVLDTIANTARPKDGA